ncbi:protein let-653 isoform X1 [Tachysurus fulvidraco]|uniref:protein let-653 isoform X1 n=1 Tax=Tachysurus fulvidraco TaxID=1234273 RepID=UPI000F4DA24B|nr:protein let-653 isoform X1 [Tachysurus fulvidraco]
MEKMSATIVLTILGTLLVPMVSMKSTANSTDVISTRAPEHELQNTSSDIQNTSSDIQNMSPVNQTESVDVENVTDAFDPNITKAENSTALTTQVPPTKEYTSKNPIAITTKKKIDVNKTTKKTTTTTTTTATTTAKKDEGTDQPRSSVYIFVLLFFILAVAVLGIIFFCVKGNRKRFSVDIHDKHEDAQIPLASVEQEICESSSKGADMKTFTTEESSPTDNIEETEEQKAPTETDQQVKESPAQTEAPAEKPAESTIEDDTTSNKTSVETLNDMLNENNSNNNAVRDVSMCFIDICLND